MENKGNELQKKENVTDNNVQNNVTKNKNKKIRTSEKQVQRQVWFVGVAVVVSIAIFFAIKGVGYVIDQKGNVGQLVTTEELVAEVKTENTTELLMEEIVETTTEEVTTEEVTTEEATTEEMYDVAEGGIHRYAYMIDDCDWSTAFIKAQEKGGYLVRINSYEEYEYLLSEIEQLGYEKIQFRVGGRRDEGTTDYYWVDENDNLYGEVINSFDYWACSAWLSGEPSYRDGDIDENCLNFFYHSDEERWVWNDVPDDIISVVPYFSGRIGYIVEYEN